MLKERDAKLEEAGDLHRFLKDLDHFQVWLSKTESVIANKDSPASLAEVVRLLSTHQQNTEESDNYIKAYGVDIEAPYNTSFRALKFATPTYGDLKTTSSP